MIEMDSSGEARYRYTRATAGLYDTLGISGTTYEIGFAEVGRLLGNIDGQAFLDFGCGSGRSTRFLTALGARHVYGVDHDRNMVDGALSKGLKGVTFLYIGGGIPLADAYLDGAVSLNVFIEIRTLRTMRAVCAEIARVLRPGRPFVIMSTNPRAFGHTFRNFSYPFTGRLSSGDMTTCIVTSEEGSFAIEDTYWAEDDYLGVLGGSGFKVATVSYPAPPTPEKWTTDEAIVSPFIVIKALRN